MFYLPYWPGKSLKKINVTPFLMLNRDKYPISRSIRLGIEVLGLLP